MAIRYTIESYNDGLAYGPLEWKEKGLLTGAYSGPYGRGELPAGLYHVRRDVLLDKPGNSSFCDSIRNCWFQLIDPQFSTDRTELGIHPDGNVMGTRGCIGILDADTSPWYNAFKSVKMGDFAILEVKIAKARPPSV